MLAPIKNWRGNKKGDEKEENTTRYPGSNFMSTAIHLDVFFHMSRSAKC